MEAEKKTMSLHNFNKWKIFFFILIEWAYAALNVYFYSKLK